MKNIVIIGMSGVGKSSSGRHIAKKLGWNFIYTDELIIRREKMTIDEIFSKLGEEHFRVIEAKIIEEVSSLENTVIATGGGVVTVEKNILNLKRNGYIYLFQGKIQTIVDNLSKGKVVRPLLRKGDDLSDSVVKLLENRENLYILYSDVLINIDGLSKEEVSKLVVVEYEKLEIIHNEG